MPLPDSSINWPPKQFDPIFTKTNEWDAWYTGDADRLSRVYGGHAGLAPSPTDNAWQRRGGIVGRIARWFWGQPTQDGQLRTKLHIPVASDIATASADLLFSEEVALVSDGMSDTDRERLDDVLNGCDWHSKLLETAELAAALGGAYLRTTWDAEVADHPLITTMSADQALPEFRYGKLWAVSFWQVVSYADNVVIRHLERHEPGRVEHGLYEGTWAELGRRIPLTEAPATKDLQVNADSAILTGWDGLTVAYVPNIRPNRVWRSLPDGKDLGRSDYAGVEPLMDGLDEVYTSWMRDIRLAKARILVPGNLLETRTPGGGASFDMDREVFTQLADIAGSAATQTLQLSAQQFAIRTAEHADTAKALLSAILRGAGYSAQTFGLAEEATATATEVHARERRSLVTREKKTRYFGRAMTGCIEAVTALDRIIFRQGGGPAIVTAEFPATSQPSILEQAQSVQALFAAQSASAEVRVKMLHPEWNKQAVAEEVALIQSEFGVSVTNPDEVSGTGFADPNAGLHLPDQPQPDQPQPDGGLPVGQ